MAAAKPIKTAVIGLGRAGWDIHVAGIRDDKRFAVTAVTDPVAERREQAATELGCESFASIKTLIKKADAELIVNATPSQMHGTVSIAALKSGRHVVVEKPVARTVAEARRMAATAKEHRRKLFMHHNYRFRSDITRLREIIDSGLIGRVFEIRVGISQFGRRNDWQTLTKNNGGLLNNHGTHYIDAVMYLMNSPIVDVWGDLKLISDAGDAEDHCKVLLRAKNGCIADFSLSTASMAPTPLWTLLGTCGTLVANGGEATVKYFNPKQVKKQTVLTGPAAGRRYGNDDRLPWREKTMPLTSRKSPTFYGNVHEVLRERGKMFVTPESVIDVMVAMAKARTHPVQKLRPAYGK